MFYVLKLINVFPQTVVSRFNKGVDNSNLYLQQTMILAIQNRVPTAHLRLPVAHHVI